MAATQTIPELTALPNPAESGLLISLSPLPTEALAAVLENLATAFPNQAVKVATPDPAPPNLSASGLLQVSTYIPAANAPSNWLLTPADYLNTYKLMTEHNASVALILGGEAQTLHPDVIAALAASSRAGADLTTPHYDLGPSDGLVNSAILYPVTRALFGTRPRFPLAIDMAISRRMAERLAAVAQKYTAANQNTAIVWPIAEAAAAGFTLAEVPGETRALPHPDVADLNALLAQIAGSLFADVDAKATFWQRSRLAYSPRAAASLVSSDLTEAVTSNETPEMDDVQPMLDSFRIAYANLHEIWSLVLPPNSLFGLKKLSLMPPATFRMPDALWVRIIYDFILAYRLRTINRGHLLGALTPLYLAWVASHLLLARASTGDAAAGTAQQLAPEKHIEALAAAFEADKPYLVSRWRWPDRFNP